jgi:hypothetical protein
VKTPAAPLRLGAPDEFRSTLDHPKDTAMTSIDHAASHAAPTDAKTLPVLNEDWLSVVIGLAIFVLALGTLAGPDLLGWAVATSVWTDPGTALGTVSKAYSGIGGSSAFVITYLVLLAVLTGGVALLKASTASRSPSRRCSGSPMAAG